MFGVIHKYKWFKVHNDGKHLLSFSIVNALTRMVFIALYYSSVHLTTYVNQHGKRIQHRLKRHTVACSSFQLEVRDTSQLFLPDRIETTTSGNEQYTTVSYVRLLTYIVFTNARITAHTCVTYTRCNWQFLRKEGAKTMHNKTSNLWVVYNILTCFNCLTITYI